MKLNPINSNHYRIRVTRIVTVCNNNFRKKLPDEFTGYPDTLKQLVTQIKNKNESWFN